MANIENNAEVEAVIKHYKEKLLKIRKNIESKYRDADFMNEYNSGYNSAISDVLDTIDTYIK